MDKENRRDCDIVQDLLPLYYDDACSPASKEFVQQHILTCEECNKIYRHLKNHTVEKIIEDESAGILARHAKKERTAAYKAGLIIAGLILLPIIITFIYSLANGGELGVFMVVLASMLFVGSMTVVPLISVENRFLKAILCSIVALLCIIFFVDRLNGSGEFTLIAIPTIFGISIVFFPFIVRALRLPVALADKKALITVCWDTVWLYLTILIVCVHDQSMKELRTGVIVATIFVLLAWIILYVTRYLSIHPCMKTGIIIILCGIWTAFAADIYVLLIEHRRQLAILDVNFSDWSTNTIINANIYVITLIVCTITGAILIIAGIIRARHKKSS